MIWRHSIFRSAAHKVKYGYVGTNVHNHTEKDNQWRGPGSIYMSWVTVEQLELIKSSLEWITEVD
jgi:hypothetical protein